MPSTMTVEPKENVHELNSEEVDCHLCDEGGCKNSYTPFVSNTGDRYCVTHGTK